MRTLTGFAAFCVGKDPKQFENFQKMKLFRIKAFQTNKHRYVSFGALQTQKVNQRLKEIAMCSLPFRFCIEGSAYELCN